MAEIFISYRRSTSEYIAQNLRSIFNYDFGYPDSAIFFDKRSILLEDYRNKITNELSKCNVFIPIIKDNYLSEIISRKENGVEDWVLVELMHAFSRNSDDNFKIVPIRDNDDLNHERIITSILNPKEKETLLHFESLQTPFSGYNKFLDNNILNEIASSIHEEYQSVFAQRDLSERVHNLICEFKNESRIKVLFIGPSTFYNITSFHRIKNQLISDIDLPDVRITQEAAIKYMGNSMLKAAEWYLSIKPKGTYRLKEIFSKPSNINSEYYNSILEAAYNFDVIINFSFIRLSTKLDKTRITKFWKFCENDFQDNLRMNLDKLANKKTKKTTVIEIQNIQQEEGHRKRPTLSHRLITSEDFVRFLRKFNHLDPLIHRVRNNENYLTVFSGVTDIDLILKHYFLKEFEDNSDKMDLASNHDIDDIHEIKRTTKILLDGIDFDVVKMNYYKSKDFQVEKIRLYEFLKNL